MRQYWAAKQQHPNALLFFRMGDFYELFYDDAKVAARELQITLTARDREKTQPMCGVPYHAAEGYLTRLLRKGYRVAICEQMEDPKLTKKIVRREVTRVLSPGTAMDPALGSSENNYLAALHVQGETAALAYLDLSTGDFRATEFSGPNALAQCADELAKLSPSELLAPTANALLNTSREISAACDQIRTKTPLEDWAFAKDYALPLLERQMGTTSLDGFGFSGHPVAAIAAGVIIHYVRQTQQTDAAHVDTIRYYERNQHMHLDQVSVRNLELLDPIFHEAGADATLCRALDCQATPMGKRLLRASILRPLVDAAAIEQRYEAVAETKQDLIKREQVRRSLSGILDLERLLARISLDSAGPRDLLALAASMQNLPQLKGNAAAFESVFWKMACERLDPLEDLSSAIATTLVAEPPLTLADGGVIAIGIHAELDELRTISHSGRSSIAAIEERERQRTGISSLKVRFNSVFGYYIEITKSNLGKNVPADYERKQTLVNAERFTTPELKEYEVKVLTAQERSVEIEKRIFGELRRNVIEHAGRIRKTSSVVAEIDLISGFAHQASLRNYSRPILDASPVLEIVGGRHPVIEQLMENAGEGRFIPNDLYLDSAGPSLLLLTGPNMGGKSTYLRQAALLAIMAQMGSFVPADRMRYGVVDRVYTRIGASDNVARGRSTFMVEMMETATILNTATDRSLILLDEMGRGTSTFDGLALAWATVEYLHAHVGARTLFATHYHELTILAEELKKLKNLRVAVKESPQGIVFLHSIEEGPANKSYGIDVARLAGLPSQVIQRARQVLKQHERSARRDVAVETEAAPMQMTMFTPISQRVLDRLEETDVNSLTPLQALNLLEELKTEIRGGSGKA
ncbi:DNA mismatch repair protein MutS [Silvibacterium acidisoli]|uniref:DNA mismatch repair protein MutS n=1 Tax=Acidobacteriaceae bacterium ZG23-2 TaxID=2883246 RepID=UPI00406C973A